MHIAAVIFDMDGLMIDTEAIIKACIQRAAGEIGYQIDDDYYATLIGRGTADCDALLIAQFGPALPLNDMKQRIRTSIRERIAADGISVKPGLHELLTLVNRHRIQTAVATSTDAEDAEFSLRASGLWGRFHTVVTGDQVQKGKPEPDIYLEAASRLRVEPTHCVALEDSSAGVLAASTAGMRTLMVPDVGQSPSPAARNAAFRVLRTLHEASQLMSEWLTTGNLVRGA